MAAAAGWIAAGGWLIAAALVASCTSDASSPAPPPPAQASASGGGASGSGAPTSPGAGGSPAGGTAGAGNANTGGAAAAGNEGGGGGGGGSGGGGVDSGPAPDAEAVDLSGGADAGSPTAPTGVVKMMVMGSSNEVGTCWRAFLWQKLRAAGITRFDFVGSNTDGPDCGVPGYDKNDESRNGTIVSDITAAEYNSRFKANPPDIVLVHFGGADILQGIAPAKVIPGYTLMVEQGRLVNPKIRFLVAQHTPMAPASCGKCGTAVPELNAAIVEWAKKISTDTSPVGSVDLFTGIDPNTDTSDKVHLNIAGAQKVSDRWVAALLPIFKP